MLLFLIGGIQKTTLLDFPEKIASIVFTQGCNFRCGYCHNPNLINFETKEKIDIESYLNFLKTRIGKLDGVVITGGEPTIQNGLYDFIKEIKNLNFAVKLDTNGTNPNILEKLINDNLLDYIAMDIKAPLGKYSEITGTKVNIENISKSINLIMNSSINYEFRTTVIKTQLLLEDFDKIGQLILGAKRYYLQKFVPSNIYDKNLMTSETYTDEEFKKICKNLEKYIKFIDFR